MGNSGGRGGGVEGVRRKGKREVEDQTKVRKGDTKKREREGGER